MSIAGEPFDFFRAWLRERSAIALEPGKEYLVEARLSGVALRQGLASADEVVRMLRQRPTPELESYFRRSIAAR